MATGGNVSFKNPPEELGITGSAGESLHYLDPMLSTLKTKDTSILADEVYVETDGVVMINDRCMATPLANQRNSTTFQDFGITPAQALANFGASRLYTAFFPFARDLEGKAHCNGLLLQKNPRKVSWFEPYNPKRVKFYHVPREVRRVATPFLGAQAGTSVEITCLYGDQTEDGTDCVHQTIRAAQEILQGRLPDHSTAAKKRYRA